MRFAITALGSAGGRTLGQVVSDIVRYLEPRRPERPGPDQPAPTVPSGDGPSSYYADRGTEPGRWLGYSATEAALIGPVDSTEFARVLAGRDPRTGARLLSASGSAGRRPSLGAGQQTRTGPCGEAFYGGDDIAAALKVTKREAEMLISAGERHTVRALVGMLAPGVDPGVVDPEGSYLVPTIEPDGSRWVTAAELDRCEQARSLGVSPNHVASCGQPTDQLSVAEAARLSGVTTRYIRYVCRAWENHRDAIQAVQAGDKQVDRAYLVAHRGTRGQWVILRRELVAFLERRVAPAVRVGFDLTLTTEKSLGVLALLGDDQTRKYVLAAIEAGNDTGLDYLELHAAGARAKGKPVLVRGLTIASFRHLTSRALDPFPHHHNVIANSVIDEHGTRRALDARGLYTHAQGASALATIAMRHQLTDSIGVRWRRGRSGSWEIDGIGDDVLREFSRRRNEIEEAIAELEAEIGRRTSLDEVQAVITGTRPAKEHVDPATLVEGWWERARRHGLTPKVLRGCLHPVLPSRNLDEMALFEQLASPTEGVCAGHSLFTCSDVLVALADLDHHGQPLHIDAAQAERLADGFLASRHVVQLDTAGLRGALARQEL
jgi:conjugative relaxase-like TrwC/TraI family protein